MTTEIKSLLLACAVSLVAAAPPAVAQASTAPQATGQALKGKIQKGEGPVRIRRPDMPPAVNVADTNETTGDTAVYNKPSTALRGVASESDFMLDFRKGSPVFAPETNTLKGKTENTKLSSDTEDESLIIEWEEWHHRVSQAIFERWRTLGMIPGVARTTLTFTRAGRVFCTVHEVDLPENVYNLAMPQYRAYSQEALRRMFARAVEDSVLPLNGSSTVHFPSRSKRDVVTLTPNFSGDVDEGYNWKHGDTERVHLK